MSKRECPVCGLTWTCVCEYEAVRDSERLRAMAPAPAPARPFKQTREWNERAAAEEGDHDISAGPAQPDHDAEVEAAVRELHDRGACLKTDPLACDTKDCGAGWFLRRAVQAGVALAEHTLMERGAKHLATAKAEGYREGREQGAKDMLDSTMDTLAAGAQRLNAERNKLEADAHATGYREGLAAEREACARLVATLTADTSGDCYLTELSRAELTAAIRRRSP